MSEPGAIMDRDRILRSLRGATPGRREHPGTYSGAPRSDAAAGATPRDAWAEFRRAAVDAGAQVQGPLSRIDAARVARARLADLGSGRSVAEAPAAELLGPGPWEVARGLPHDFADVSLAIALGAFGVCENGAVLLSADLAPNRALWVLCEHLLLLVHSTDLVVDMHEAIARVVARGLCAPHCVWVAGPSKTADIEQALVEGAHGPRTLWILGIR